MCGDSHTSTHGALGCLAFGVGSSEVTHVLATQTLWQTKPKAMRVTIDGALGFGITGKDVILAIIARIGAGGGTGHVLEYAGSGIRQLSIEGRLTLCNMSIEGGGRAGMIAPDDTTYEYIAGRPYAPKGEAWDRALAFWRTLPSDDGAAFDREVTLARPRDRADGHLGHQPRGRSPGHRARSPIPRRPPMPHGVMGRPARSPTWASSPARRSPRSPSTASSSAHAPTAASRTCAWRRRSPRAARLRSPAGSCRAPA